MTTDFKHVVDAIMLILAGIASVAATLASFIASAFAIAWYSVRFYGLWKEWKAKKNGNQ